MEARQGLGRAWWDPGDLDLEIAAVAQVGGQRRPWGQVMAVSVQRRKAAESRELGH